MSAIRGLTLASPLTVTELTNISVGVELAVIVGIWFCVEAVLIGLGYMVARWNVKGPMVGMAIALTVLFVPLAIIVPHTKGDRLSILEGTIESVDDTHRNIEGVLSTKVFLDGYQGMNAYVCQNEVSRSELEKMRGEEVVLLCDRKGVGLAVKPAAATCHAQSWMKKLEVSPWRISRSHSSTGMI